MMNIVSQALASALDRTKVSDRNAVYVLSATAATLGHNVEEFSINRSTIRRSRIDARNKITDSLKETFDAQIPLTVHWDGKILPELTGTGKVDRLPVLVSGAGVSKLLGVPKLPSGTGKETAKAVLDCLEEWGIKDRTQAMSFDTTISNTGHRAGACKLIEFNLGRDLLNLACRHHIMEIVAQKVFAACDIHSTSPDILLFKRFQQHWQFSNQKNFEVIEEEVTERENIINFCEQQLTDSQTRDDYRELLELIIIYLGASPSRGIRFMQPGALHRARWMARVIYAVKICLLFSQFKMTKREQASIKRFAAFAVSLYVRSWFVAPLAAAAPANDLAFLKQLPTYNDKVVSSAAIKAFSRHLWYLNELLVSLSFFDSDVSLTVKRDMINALNKDGTDNPEKRINLMVTQCIHEKTVADFVTSSSHLFFQMLDIDTEFLSVDPSEWDRSSDYQSAMNTVKALKVVNDSTE